MTHHLNWNGSDASAFKPTCSRRGVARGLWRAQRWQMAQASGHARVVAPSGAAIASAQALVMAGSARPIRASAHSPVALLALGLRHGSREALWDSAPLGIRAGEATVDRSLRRRG